MAEGGGDGALIVPEYEGSSPASGEMSGAELDAKRPALAVRIDPKVAGGASVLALVLVLVLVLAGGSEPDAGGVPAGFAGDVAAEEEAAGVPPLGGEGCSATAARARQLGRGGLTNAAVPGETSAYTISVDGVDRAFRLHLPAAYLQAAQPLPVVFNFHGWGSSGRAQERSTKMSELADSLPANASFISVYPDAMDDINEAAYTDPEFGPTPAWNGGGCNSSPGPAGETCEQATTGNIQNGYGALDLSYQSCAALEGSPSSGSYCNCCSCADDIGFVQKMLQTLQDEHCIDRRRVYATGMSYGGLFSYQVALSLPRTFAAVAPVAGGILKGFATQPAGPAAGGYIGVLDVHGWCKRCLDSSQHLRVALSFVCR